jgi:hypothetical protein
MATFADEIANALKEVKKQEDDFIEQYTPIIKQGIIDAIKDESNFYTFYQYEHDEDPQYFKKHSLYREHYKPRRIHNALNKIAKLLGVKTPDYEKEMIHHVVGGCDSDCECDDCINNDENWKAVIGYQFYYPRYDASIIDDVCVICLEGFKSGETVSQCKKCRDCIHYHCRKETYLVVQCGICRDCAYYNVDNDTYVLIPRTKRSSTTKCITCTTQDLAEDSSAVVVI